MTQMVAASIGLAALCGGAFFLLVIPVMFVSLWLEHRRTHKRATGLLICSMMVAGFLASAILVWNLAVAQGWHLPLLTTMEASVNAERFGHPTEHAAENILVWVLFFGVAGGLAGGVIAATAARLRTRRQRA